MRLKSLVVIAGAAVLIGATYSVRAMTSHRADTSADRGMVATIAGPMPSALPEVDRLIALFEERTSQRTDPLDFRTLGRHYLERAGLTGDPDAYRSAIEVLQTANELAPEHVGTLVDLGLASMGVHQFLDALGAVGGAVSLAPEDLRAQLVLGDVLFALGRYGEARTQFETVAATATEDPGVLIRLAELAWHTGDNQGAIDLSRLAAESAAAFGVDARAQAFYLTEHGHHLANNGQLGEAEHTLGLARQLDPSWAAPIAELARVQSLGGAYEAAIDNLGTALDLTADIDWQMMLVDLLRVTGRTSEAAAASETLAAMVEAATLQGPVYARQIARFYLGHDKVDSAIDIASEEVAARSDVYGLDLYAWALHQSGDREKAWTAIAAAIDIGTRDPVVLYHAGVIAQSSGHGQLARKYLTEGLSINPLFDMSLADDARARLETMS